MQRTDVAINAAMRSVPAVWRARRARAVPYALYGLMLVMMCGGLLASEFRLAYDSDQVAGIVTLQNWRLFGAGTAWLPPDNFVLKAPVYLLVQAVLPNSPAAMFAIALVIVGIAFTLFFVAYRLLSDRALRPADYLPLLLLASLGSTFYYTLREPNSRNLETGVAFIGMAAAVRYLTGQRPFPTGARRYALLGAAAMAVGLLIFNDPFFLYALVVPFALTMLARFFRRGARRRALEVVGFFGAAALASELWRIVFGWLHVATAATQVQIVKLNQVGYHMSLAVGGLLHMWNVACTGHPLLDVRTAAALANAGLLALMFAAPAIVWIVRRPLVWWQWFLLLQPYFFIAVFILNGQVTDGGSSRYFVIEPFFEALILCLLIGTITRQRLRLLLQGTIIAACLLNVSATLQVLSAGDQNINAHHQAIVQSVRHYGLTKGYADYWSADINTYLSGNSIEFIAAACRADGVHTYRWNMDDRVIHLPAVRTFYLVDKAAQQSDSCTVAMVEQQLGAPAESIAIDSQALLLIYNGDITARMLPG